MEFEDYLKKEAKKVDLELEKVLSDFLKQTQKTNLKLLPFAKKLIKSCAGGKKIRGVLCKLGFELTSSKFNPPAGGQNSKLKNEIYKISAALEILHTALLIHDDIMDQSEIRRGKPSLYKLLSESEALVLGDIALYLPLKIITDSKFDDEIKIKVLNRFTQMVIDTGWGQLMDVRQVQNYEDKEFIDLYKTAKYTIAGPLIMGAILGGADEKLIKNLEEFGEKLGIAFQLRDDILDEEGNDLKKALSYVVEAKKMIPNLIEDANLKKILENMAGFMVERSK